MGQWSPPWRHRRVASFLELLACWSEVKQRPALPAAKCGGISSRLFNPVCKSLSYSQLHCRAIPQTGGRTAATMDRAVRSSPSALVFGLILLAPAFTTGFVAPRVPFLRAESIAADPSLASDRVILQTRATRSTPGVRSRTAVPTQNPVAWAMAGRNEGKALACMRPWSQQPRLSIPQHR